MSNDRHPMDEWDDQKDEANKLAGDQALRESSLVYQVFSTEPGKLLMSKWIKLLMDVPTATTGMDMLTIGLNEGEKRFVRSILQSINLHEKSL